MGDAGFRPLVATTQALWTGVPLSEAEVAVLPKGNGALGETVLEGAVNSWRGRMLAAGATPGRNRLLASAAGQGGQSIEALSPGASPPLFDTFADCLSLARATARAERLFYGVVALLFLQGEANVYDADSAAYRSRLAALHRSMLAEVAAGGQTAPPAFFMYQTSGLFGSGTNTIAQAQMEFALATPGVFMVAPCYPVPAKKDDGHLDPNGYRWLGAQFGKAMHRVLTLKQDFLPLHPLRATLAGRRVHLAFHVPVPPLAFGRPFSAQQRVEPADRGFEAHDTAGRIDLAEIVLSGPDSVDLLLARDAAGPVKLLYASKKVGGCGALHDSDPTVAADPYVYDPTTGHFPAANHPDLNGRPYPLHNWCAAFAIPVQVTA